MRRGLTPEQRERKNARERERYWGDPEYREKKNARRREALREQWANDEAFRMWKVAYNYNRRARARVAEDTQRLRDEFGGSLFPASPWREPATYAEYKERWERWASVDLSPPPTPDTNLSLLTWR